MVIIKIIVIIYSLFTLVAIVSDMKENHFMFLHPIYIVFSMLLILSSWKELGFVLLAAGLLGLMLAAFLTGIVKHDFHWSHHLVRLVISILIFSIAFYLKR